MNTIQELQVEIEKIKTTTEALSQAIQKIGQAMYGKQAENQPPKDENKKEEKPEDKKE